MHIGIVGPQYSGKTTVFSALTGIVQDAESGGKKANIGMIQVPDERVDQLYAIYKSKKVTYADISFVDIQSPLEKKNEQGGLDSQTIAQLRNADALVIVVRAFENEAVPHPRDKIDPGADFLNYEEELRITDYIQIENRLERIKKENKKGIEPDTLQKCLDQLEAGKPLRLLGLSEPEQKVIEGFRFLTQKPVLVLINETEGENRSYPEILKEAEQAGSGCMNLSAKLEQEISQLPAGEQEEFLKEMGLERPAREKFIRESYKMMELISFFTVGEDEVRAWTIEQHTKAPGAAGKIHSDLERGFIRAEVVHYDDFIAAGSMAKAREGGTLRQEGKEYVVKDGDILEIKFNV